MNKAIFLSVIILVSFISVFAEIKFQPPIYTIGRYQNFKYIYRLNQDTMLTSCGPFGVDGYLLSLPWVNSVAKDNLGNLWCAVCNSTWLTVIDRNWNQTKYLSADGKGFGQIHSIAFSDGMIVVGCDSGLSITTPVNGKPGTWTNFSTKPITEVVASHGQIWAISLNASLYRDSAGTLLTYNNIMPASTDLAFYPYYGTLDNDGNFWLSYGKLNKTTSPNEFGLAKFNGIWTSYFVRVCDVNKTGVTIDTSIIGKMGVDKNNQLWFVNDQPFGYDFSIGKINLADMSIEKINYIRADSGVNPSPLTWQPLTLTITPAGEALFGGFGCFVPVDYGSSVIWHPAIAKSPATANQKNLSGEIFDIRGRKIASVNSLKSFSKSLSHGNYFFRPANINAKAEKFSVVK